MPDVLTPDDEETATPEHDRRLALRKPETPVTLSELASLKGEAIEIVEARVQILATLRKAALRATSPEDWILHKAPEDAGGQVVGYLQDSGCERVRDLFGINIFGVSAPEKVAGAEAGVFHYIVSGSGRCTLTRQVIENVEGGRSSTDDICRGKTGAELELLVRKSARANLDGRIVRELAGLGSVPLNELEAAWSGTNKKADNCRRGKGFGSRAERKGADVREKGQPDIAPPTCAVCGSTAEYVAGGTSKEGRTYDAFWSCPKRKTHGNERWSIKASEWEAQASKATPAAAPAPAVATGPMPTSDEVFGKK